jgi:MFS family permease
MFILTLVLFLLARFSSPALAGWLTFAAIVPGLLVSPVAGVQLDRLGPTIAVRIDMIASATFIGAISIVGWLDWATPPVLLFLVILFSLAGPLGAAGTRTLLPRLVPSHALDRANALDTAIYAVVDVVGPAMAGIIVAWLGPESAMSMISFSYAAAAICLSFDRSFPDWRPDRFRSCNSGRHSDRRQTTDAARPRHLLFDVPGHLGRALCCGPSFRR